jgi:D-alanyl-D-alanine carboxypeptidase/D-alanyl-D-alanine endopeptidase (penicillin-binding protein 7)
MTRFFMGLVLSLMFSTASAITAKSYIVLDEQGQVILEKDADAIRSIASITKLFTARTASSADPNELIEVVPTDRRLGLMRSSPLRVGQKYTRAELIELSLISSDNIAATALGRIDPIVSPLPPNTTIVEASGLDAENKSTARSIAALAQDLVGTELARISVQPSVKIGSATKSSTNPLITRPGWSFELSKTGYIGAAGGCLVVIFRAGDRLLTAVILGSRDVPARWRDLYDLRRMVDNSQFAAPFVTKRRRGR